MMYDDIANNVQNPYKNNMINQPNGPNVYEGCQKDYTGSSVTPSNFLRILSGQSMAGIGSGRTVQSTAEDNIFVFFSDHGATGLIAFPNEYLYADDLNKTITAMHDNNQYKQMLLYIEACEAGSMFFNILSSGINVLAVTASDPTHSSYAVYWDSSRQAYLGDVFSVNWMEDSDKTPPSTETVEQQVNIVRDLTTTSAVCTYGDDSIQSEILSDFIGGKAEAKRAIAKAAREVHTDVVNSRDVDLVTLERRLGQAATEDLSVAMEQLEEALNARKTVDARIAALVDAVYNGTAIPSAPASPRAGPSPLCTIGVPISDFDCLKQMVTMWTRFCGALDSYSLKHVATLNKMCAAPVSRDAIFGQMSRICAN